MKYRDIPLYKASRKWPGRGTRIWAQLKIRLLAHNDLRPMRRTKLSKMGQARIEAEQAKSETSPGDQEAHLAAFLATLNEKQRRLYAGFESLRLGRGGDVVVARRTGLNVKTVARGRRELEAGDISLDRIRAQGAGRPKKNS